MNEGYGNEGYFILMVFVVLLFVITVAGLEIAIYYSSVHEEDVNSKHVGEVFRCVESGISYDDLYAAFTNEEGLIECHYRVSRDMVERKILGGCER